MLSERIWSGYLPTATWGWISAGGALLLALTGWLIKRANARLAYLHALVAIALFNLGLVVILDGNSLIFALALEAACLHLISFRYKDVGMEVCGTLVFGAVGLWMVSRLLQGGDQPVVFNPQALTDLAVLGLAFGSSFFVSRVELRLAYRGFFHVAALAWLWRELHTLPNGDGYVMLAWAAYGILLHLVARRLDSERLDAKGTTIAAHLAFEGALGLLAYRMATGYSGSPLFNQKAAIDLVVMGMALVTSFLVTGKRTAAVYRLVVHAAVLAWLWREATYVDFTSGYVMLRWTTYVALVAFISHRLRDRVTLIAAAAPFPAIALLFIWHITLGRLSYLLYLNSDTLIDLAVLVLVLAVSFVAQPERIKLCLRLGFHAGMLAWFWRVLPDNYDLGYVMVAWTLYIALILLISDWKRDRLTAQALHIPFAMVAYGFLTHMSVDLRSTSDPIFLNVPFMLHLAVVVLAAFISFFVYPAEARGFYRVAVHAAVLALLWHELSPLAYGYHYIMFAWMAYAVLLHVIAWRTSDKVTLWTAHIVAGAVGTWLIGRIVFGLLTTNPNVTPIFNPQGLADLGIVLLAVLAYSILRSNKQVALRYGLWLHLAVLGWTWQELGLYPNGNGYVTIAWGLYALGLIAASLKLDRNRVLMLCGLSTLFAVAAKLFLIDLRYVDTYGESSSSSASAASSSWLAISSRTC